MKVIKQSPYMEVEYIISSSDSLNRELLTHTLESWRNHLHIISIAAINNFENSLEFFLIFQIRRNLNTALTFVAMTNFHRLLVENPLMQCPSM